MSRELEVIGLDDLGIVRIRGADALRFLQGQLSNDVTRLRSGESMLAGFHNPQGRTIALLRLVLRASDDVLAVVPRELAIAVAARLSKFILRSKVRIADESGSWRINGVIGATHIPLAQNPAVSVTVGNEPARCLLIEAVGDARNSADALACAAGPREHWQRLDIAAGQPQVVAATSEQFVAQMLNLDVLGAIAFDKGCYTGQEVIARAHYRGRVKRRLQRFVTSAASSQLAPGASGTLSDGRTFKIVASALLEGGRCEFLAVAALPAVGLGDTHSAQSGGSAGMHEVAPEVPAEPGSGPLVQAEQLPLPYCLPE